MKKRKTASFWRIILLVVMLTVLSACSGYGPGREALSKKDILNGNMMRTSGMISAFCLESSIISYAQPKPATARFECEGSWTDEDRLNEDIKRINEMIYACCLESNIITYDQLKPALASFCYIQDKYSGKRIRKVDEKEYYYPRFVLEWERDEASDKEDIMYTITPLPWNEIGIYKGIKVTPVYVTDTAEKIKEMNEKLKEFMILTTNRHKLDDLTERFAQFQKEYSGKLLCVDPVKGEIRCPDYAFETDDLTWQRNFGESYVTEWQSYPMGKDKEGFCKGLRVVVYGLKVSEDYTAKAGEIAHLWKKNPNLSAEEEEMLNLTTLIPANAYIYVYVNKYDSETK